MPGDKGNTDAPWFVIYPLGSSFSYERVDENHKGAGWCGAWWTAWRREATLWSGSALTEKAGTIPLQVGQLKEVGEWLKVNGTGIYATRAR